MLTGFTTDACVEGTLLITRDLKEVLVFIEHA
jgi:hypothetical protein